MTLVMMMEMLMRSGSAAAARPVPSKTHSSAMSGRLSAAAQAGGHGGEGGEWGEVGTAPAWRPSAAWPLGSLSPPCRRGVASEGGGRWRAWGCEALVVGVGALDKGTVIGFRSPFQ